MIYIVVGKKKYRLFDKKRDAKKFAKGKEILTFLNELDFLNWTKNLKL